MKTHLLKIAIVALTAFSLNSNAACIPHEIAESAVSGRTYKLQNYLEPDYPVYLTFSDSKDLAAVYGSVLDGHPGGKFHYQGNCHGHIIVTFTSDIQPDSKPVEVLHLWPVDSEYFHLRSISDKVTLFKIVSNGNESNELGLKFSKRFFWTYLSDDTQKRVCWDDKAGIVVSDANCN